MQKIDRGKTMKRDEIRDALIDSGLQDSEVECLMRAYDSGNTAETEKILSKRREVLLEEIHKCEHSIECLDYFRYKRRAKEGGKQGNSEMQRTV